ncbi:MAG: winged helix-turn-helix transcriptional regulator [Oscillospiraceae bacterium]|nr:winged helix-turn-helix transcriptional regulator [Oscillospiraceae bacterium]
MRTGEKERIFKALGDSNRVEIMDLIKDGELSAGRILNKIQMGQSTLSHHMKILCDCGIVNARKESRWVYYSINKETVKEVMAFMDEWLK